MQDESNEMSQLAAIPRDMAVLKMENDNIMAMAAATPRDMKRIKQEMVDQLQAFPIFAQAAVYSKPVGNGKKVRGLSVRAAEALAEAYGYCRIRTHAEPEYRDGKEVGAIVTASFTDFQKGRVWEDSGFLSKWYKKSGGGMAMTPDDRFWNVVVKAELSRRVREVILRSVPPGMKMELQSIAEKEMLNTLTDADVQKIIAGFEKLNCSLAMLETYVGKTVDAGWNKDDRVDLVAAYVALKDGETTVGELFPAAGNSGASESSSLNDELKKGTAKPDPAVAAHAKAEQEKAAAKKAAAEAAIEAGKQQAAAETKPKADESKPVADEASQEPDQPKQPETPAARFPDATAEQLKFYGFQIDRIMAAKSSKVLANIRGPLDSALDAGKLTGQQYTDLLNEIEEAHQQFE